MVLYYQNKKLTEQQFKNESEFEINIIESSSLFLLKFSYKFLYTFEQE